MPEIRYVCAGTCGANVSEAEYENGLKKCGEHACPMYGHEFEKRLKCPICGALYKREEEEMRRRRGLTER
ncbi:MAG: hypothetical protein AAB731_01370, partial [Patescibacteria group bacterium]